MKGLLQSKIFKENLRKWLFMYVGTIALLTTVITYSKYVSSLGDNDQARGSKFDIIITPISCPKPADEDNSFCSVEYSSTSTCRPGATIASCFTVDTTGVEVSSDVWLTFDQSIKKGNNGGYYVNTDDDNIKKLFEIEGIDIIENQDTTFKTIYSNNSATGGWELDNKLSIPNRIKLRRSLLTSETSRNWTVRVRTKFVNEESNNLENQDSLPLVKVGYIMQQITGSSPAEKEGDE